MERRSLSSRTASENAPFAAFADEARHYYGVMFHPEVVHTPDGAKLLSNFVHNIAGCAGDWTMAAFREHEIAKIRAQVGKGRVVCGLSGGVDSAVAAVLLHEAIGDVRLVCQGVVVGEDVEPDDRVAVGARLADDGSFGGLWEIAHRALDRVRDVRRGEVEVASRGELDVDRGQAVVARRGDRFDPLDGAKQNAVGPRPHALQVGCQRHARPLRKDDRGEVDPSRA